jgi:hypothetical protein
MLLVDGGTIETHCPEGRRPSVSIELPVTNEPARSFSEVEHDARGQAKAVLCVGGGVGELSAEVAEAYGADGQVMIEPYVQASACVERQRIGI